MVVAGLSKDFYVSNSSEHWDQAIAHSGGPGQYVSIVPFDLSFARHPRDLEVFIRNVDTRHPLKRIILDEVPPEVFDRFELVFGTARVFRFEDIELDERASQIKSSISSVSCVAFETGDHRSEMIARNYANYHGLEVREIDVPSSLEKRYLEKLSLAAGSPDFDAALASLPSRSLEAFERVTVVCGHFFPYSLLYRNNAVSVLPRVFAPRVMIEEVIHADYERLHVSVLAIDGTRVQSPALVSEYAAIVPKFEQSHMRVVIFGAGTDSHVFQTLLDYYPFDLMFIAGHGIMLESRRSNYIFPAADGPHQLAMNEQHATTWYRGTIEEIDGSPVEQCNPNLVDAAMKAMEAHELQRISYRVLGKGDEALLLPNGEVHMGNCRRGSVSSLPLVFGTVAPRRLARIYWEEARAGSLVHFGPSQMPVPTASPRNLFAK